MRYLKTFENYNNELTIDLYHGTSEENAQSMVENGWQPKNMIGGNMGKSGILYLTSVIEDALWFAEEKGHSTVLKVTNIPVSFLIFDPEDGDADLYDYSIRNAVDRVKNGEMMPVKFALIKPLPKEHFQIIKR